ncbi:MAG: hypothetical protein ACOVO3_07890 [Fluviicola sp.]
MKALITLENYEAFYLDYLEGNLSDADRAAFEKFLTEHPELQLEDDLLPEFTLLDEDTMLSSVEKMALKRDYEDTAILPENLEGLLIADSEGLLSDPKKKALEAWIAANPLWKQEAQLYAQAHVAPNMQEQTDKQVLYRKGGAIIPLWWSGVAAMAAGIALFVTLGIGDDREFGPGSNAAFTAKMPRVEWNNTTGQTDSNTSIQPIQNGPVKSYKKQAGTPEIKKPEQQPTIQQAPENNGPVNLANNDGSLPPQLPGPNKVTLNPETSPNNQDFALNQNRMSNPIAMITGVLSEKLNTPIDLKTAKKTKEEKGGFYLKIGKLEISHTGRKR